MQVIYERCAGADAGKDEIAVAVRVPGGGRDGRRTQKRTYRAFYGVLREMARWLESPGVTRVATEATGTYSQPVYCALVESGFEEVIVCNAGHVKNVPGSATDASDRARAVTSCPMPRREQHGDEGGPDVAGPAGNEHAQGGSSLLIRPCSS